MTNLAARPEVVGATRRLTSLDGLRGVAALVVVFHHSLLTISALSIHYFESVAGPHSNYWWLLFTPLHVLWGGTEAVYLFFVLSGIVLTRAAGAAGFEWGTYFPSRLVRLYGPVVASVILAAILIFFVPRTGTPVGTWMGIHTNYSSATLLQDMTLLTGTSPADTPLWSLQWEVLFSLLLPVAVLLARRRFMWLTILVCLIVLTVGFWRGVAILQFMPMFAIGVALAGSWEKVAAFADRVTALRLGSLIWAVAVAAALLLVGIYWDVLPTLPGSQTFVLTRPLTLVAVIVLIVAAAFWRPFHRVLDTRLFQWLGRISFSLYLVHEPIIVSVAILTHESRLAIPVAIALAVGVAVVFYLFVERPLHHLAQRIKGSRV